MTANSFEVLPLNWYQFSDSGFYSSFMVTLDDVFKTSLNQSTKEHILTLLDTMVELKGGYYAFGYFDKE